MPCLQNREVDYFHHCFWLDRVGVTHLRVLRPISCRTTGYFPSTSGMIQMWPGKKRRIQRSPKMPPPEFLSIVWLCGWGDVPVTEALKAQGPGFEHPCKKTGTVVCACNPSNGKTGEGSIRIPGVHWPAITEPVWQHSRPMREAVST